MNAKTFDQLTNGVRLDLKIELTRVSDSVANHYGARCLELFRTDSQMSTEERQQWQDLHDTIKAMTATINPLPTKPTI
jgi:hypothetical protein